MGDWRFLSHLNSEPTLLYVSPKKGDSHILESILKEKKTKIKTKQLEILVTKRKHRPMPCAGACTSDLLPAFSASPEETPVPRRLHRPSLPLSLSPMSTLWFISATSSLLLRLQVTYASARQLCSSEMGCSAKKKVTEISCSSHFTTFTTTQPLPAGYKNLPLVHSLHLHAVFTSCAFFFFVNLQPTWHMLT